MQQKRFQTRAVIRKKIMDQDLAIEISKTESAANERRLTQRASDGD
jgi:hypothetical protein